MRAGDLKDRITLQRNAPTRDAGAAPVDSWSNVMMIWAAVEPLSGREFFDAARVYGEISDLIKMRWRPGVTRGMRAVLGSRIFDIQAVLEIGRRAELHLMATERS